MSKKSAIYLDYAATTPLHPEVLKQMLPYLTDNFYNPSATYMSAKKVRKDIESSRALVAHWLGAKSSEIIFTAGATEANNMAIQGIMDAFSDGNIVTTSIEHESVLNCAKDYKYRLVNVDTTGRIDLKDLKNKIDDNTVIVSVMYANNEIGTIEPLTQVAKLINEIRLSRSSGSKPIYFHSDAAQAGNYLDLHVSRLGIDLMSLNGGKIYGPKQSGVLYVKAGISLKPIIFGGGQERGLRSGTENVANIVGLSSALDLVQKSKDQEYHRLHILQQQFIELLNQKIPAVQINGSLKQRLPNNVHISLPKNIDNERVLMELDEHNIEVATGSACSASNEEPSHVLKAINKTILEAQSSLRLTMGRDTSVNQLEIVANTLAKIVKNYKQN